MMFIFGVLGAYWGVKLVPIEYWPLNLMFITYPLIFLGLLIDVSFLKLKRKFFDVWVKKYGPKGNLMG